VTVRRLVPHLLVAAPVMAALVVGALSITSAASGDDRTASRAVQVDPAQADPEQAALGARLFAEQCSSCHGLDGLGVEDRGPSLEHEGEAAANFVLRTGRMPLAAPNLQTRRSPVRYTEEEILALVAHVGSLGDGPDIPEVDTSSADVGNGGDLYRLNCAACHVASGAGAPIGGNRRAPNLMKATPTEIGEAILVGPGAMPVFDSFSPSDIDDIAAYIEHLQEQDTTSARRFGGAGPAAEGLAAWLLALVPLIAFTRWIGHPKVGRDAPVDETSDADVEVGDVG